MKPSLKALQNIHHAAYRCRDAEQTRWFYEDILGLKLAAAFEEDIDFGEGLGRNRNFLHIFFEMGDGNYLAFFDEPGISKAEDFKRKDSFDMHIALETDTMEDLLAWHKHINDAGKTCLGPIDHGFVHSMYMYDPNGIQVEITCRASDPKLMEHQNDTARSSLATWTKKTREIKEKTFGADTLDKRAR
ncbi:catechol 2,3-dioxygenase-like lactoylglutathione lyase family enzyme [Zhongshania antarctica]|uniref:Catechol 2,3-dioxygenase-like lactoylglutathione lyase family enzyme n=1 Tax=Zhongshania antarctica TaxID=641702 RepID=A0A840R3E5_9GAMM|nr:VOC family protein [Zhongshania antarctica]MBB5187056.1 catechol 2,3-dioxygenase-like lactoylglutathione lyase family enzyme [Zhongshania antarctica]